MSNKTDTVLLTFWLGSALYLTLFQPEREVAFWACMVIALVILRTPREP